MFFHLSTLTKVVPEVYQANLFPNSENHAVTRIREKWNKLLASEHTLHSGSRVLRSLSPNCQEAGTSLTYSQWRISHWSHFLIYQYCGIKLLIFHIISRKSNPLYLSHI